MTTIQLPAVGTPATIWLFSDSLPAVVTKVNAKSLVVQRVGVSEETRKRINEGEPLPCWAWEGNLEDIIGDPERFKLVSVAEDGTPRYRNGSTSLSLGRSVKITDYRR